MLNVKTQISVNETKENSIHVVDKNVIVSPI